MRSVLDLFDYLVLFATVPSEWLESYDLIRRLMNSGVNLRRRIDASAQASRPCSSDSSWRHFGRAEPRQTASET